MEHLRNRQLIATLMIVVIVFVCCGTAFSLDWPIAPDSSTHVVSSFYGAWQGMWRAELSRNVNYFHAAIDLPGDTLETVYAVESGYVKAILTIFASDYHWRIVIADSAGSQECEGWLYAHILESSIPFTPGEWVNIGDSLGVLVTWPNEFTQIHLHFARLRFSGDPTVWDNGFWDYDFIGNPMSYLSPAGDTDPPFLQNAFGNQLFAICGNETSDYFGIGEPISGDVDIICSAYDYCGYYQYKNTPYRIEYSIMGDSVIPWTLGIEFSDAVDSYNGEMEALSKTVFKYDSQCSTGFIDSVAAFHIMTNSDGDAIIEVSDTSGCWPTIEFHNGDYRILARLTDYDGNSFVDSMTVTVGNYRQFTASIALGDGNPYLSGTNLSIAPDGLSDTSNSLGEVSFDNVGGGSQQIVISRIGYVTIDTIIVMNQDTSLNITLVLGDYVCGDIDSDSSGPNIADLTYLVAFLFSGGSPPPVLASANVDGITGPAGPIDVGDLTHLVAYLFTGGAEPVCEQFFA